MTHHTTNHLFQGGGGEEGEEREGSFMLHKGKDGWLYHCRKEGGERGRKEEGEKNNNKDDYYSKDKYLDPHTTH